MNRLQRRVCGRRAHAAILVGAGSLIGLAGVAQGMGPTSVRAENSTSVTYTTTGEHAFVVPAGVTSVHVVAVGASGQPGSGPSLVAGAGGDGAMVTADLAVAPGATLYAEVDEGGGRGGAGTDSNFNPDPTGGAGGGESDVRSCSLNTCEPSGER